MTEGTSNSTTLFHNFMSHFFGGFTCSNFLLELLTNTGMDTRFRAKLTRLMAPSSLLYRYDMMLYYSASSNADFPVAFLSGRHFNVHVYLKPDTFCIHKLVWYHESGYFDVPICGVLFRFNWCNVCLRENPSSPIDCYIILELKKSISVTILSGTIPNLFWVWLSHPI